MSRAWALVLDPARSARRAFLAWAASLAALVVLTVAFWPAFQEAMEVFDIFEFFEQLPPGILEAFGMQGFDTAEGYLRGNLYELLVPLLFGAAAIAFASSLIASEEDSGRLELTLAQPITRTAAFAGRSAAMATLMVGLAVVVIVSQVVSDAVFGLEIGLDRLLAAILLCWLLGMLHGCLALAIAGLAPRPALVLGIPLVVLIAGFVIAALFPLSDELRDWASISPWDWALDGDPLVNGADAWRCLALALPGAALAALGLLAFARRDIRSA